MQSTASSNPSPTSRVVRQRPDSFTNAIASNGDPTFEPNQWARKPPAKGEAQQLGFAVCIPLPARIPGIKRRPRKRGTQHINKIRRRIVTTTRARAHAQRNLQHKRTPSVVDYASLHPFYGEPHAQCSLPRQVAPTSISCFVHAPRSEAVNTSFSLRILA